jgi:hypothetical protein
LACTGGGNQGDIGTVLRLILTEPLMSVLMYRVIHCLFLSLITLSSASFSMEKDHNDVTENFTCIKTTSGNKATQNFRKKRAFRNAECFIPIFDEDNGKIICALFALANDTLFSFLDIWSDDEPLIILSQVNKTLREKVLLYFAFANGIREKLDGDKSIVVLEYLQIQSYLTHKQLFISYLNQNNFLDNKGLLERDLIDNFNLAELQSLIDDDDDLVFRFLHYFGMDLRITNEAMENIVHRAANSPKVVAFILKEYPELAFSWDRDHNTPFHAAAVRGNMNVVKLLISHFKDHTKLMKTFTGTVIAKMRRMKFPTQHVNIFYSKKKQELNLHITEFYQNASKHSHDDIIFPSIYSVIVNVKNISNLTALDLAYQNGHDSVVSFLGENKCMGTLRALK